MRRLTLTLTLLMSLQATAQYQPFPNLEFVDINNLKAGHLLHGDMWWAADTGAVTPLCEFPKGSGKHVSFATALWMSGYDPAQQLRVAAEVYRQAEQDYWPGPLLSSGTAAQKYQQAQAWARIWKVDRRQIDSFRRIVIRTGANVPPVILEWPAKGNIFARGHNGAQLSVTSDMAPFVDANQDGIYNAIDGDHPDLKGDQMLWWIVNDDGPVRNQAHPLPLGIEVRHSVYAYTRGTLADNMISYEYELRNTGPRYDSFRLGHFSSVDLGYPFDDFVGFDSARRAAFTYNGRSFDGPGQTNSYGMTIPMTAMALLELPGDAGNTYVPAGSFLHANNPLSVSPTEVYYQMHSTYTDGTPLPNNARYEFEEDDECFLNRMPFDRNFVLASNSFSFPANSTRKIAMAQVVTPNGSGCPNMTFTGIKEAVDTAWSVYCRPLPPVPLGAGAVAPRKPLRLYPNPARDLLTIETGAQRPGTIAVADVLGKTIRPEQLVNGSTIQLITAPLPKGVYTLIYTGSEEVWTGLFVKD